MSVTIKLLKTANDENVINKSYSTIATLSAEINAEISVDSPDVVVNYASGYLACNYVYIDSFSRYYFVRNAALLNGNQLRLSLESDPLMSFKSGILGSQCIASRSTSHPNMELVDNLVAFKPIPKRKYTKMSTAFTPGAGSGSYVLTIGGK